MIENDELFKEYVEFMGGRYPNPTHYPRQFEYTVRMFLFSKGYPSKSNQPTNYQGE